MPSAEIARALVPLAGGQPPRLLGCWLGRAAVEGADRVFHEAGIPSYPTPEDAVRAFSMLVAYRRNQAQLMEAPPASPAGARPELGAARALVDAALAAGREWLSEPEAKTLLAAAGVRSS